MIGKFVRCVYNFPAETETDLEIKIGDLIRVTKVINNDWYEGQLSDKKGQFPTAYIEECADVFDLAIAIRSFSGDQEGDLSFNSDDYIVITEIVDENWMQGYIQGGSHGLFPSAFVKQISLDEPTFSGENIITSENTSVVSNGTSVATDATSTVVKEPEWVDVLDNFSAMDANELDLFAGTKVQVLYDVDDFWCKGVSESGKEGIFPRNFVDLPEIVEDKADNDETSEVNTEEPEKKNDDKEMEGVIGRTVALYNFSSSQEGDLSFNIGDEVSLLEKINDNWMRGKVDNRIGMFPSNYVQVKEMYQTDETVSSKVSDNNLVEDDHDADDYINMEVYDSEMKSTVSQAEGVSNNSTSLNDESSITNKSNSSEQSSNVTYENIAISPRKSSQSPSPSDTHKKTVIKSAKPQRPKLPDSKKPIDETSPFSYQFKTKSQPLVIIAVQYFKQGSTSVIMLKNWKNDLFTEKSANRGVNGD